MRSEREGHQCVGIAQTCPLCLAVDIADYCSDKFRVYQICRHCSLVFVPSQYHLSEQDEQERYDLHKNDPSDSGYRRFLSRIVDPLKEHIPMGALGLDFGCGPGPALSIMLQEAGYEVDTYDKFYAYRPEVFEKTYDFVTITEVVEHLSNPRFELERLFGLIKAGGLLAIMTKLVIDRSAFENWHYKRDMTHISFFSNATFEWLGKFWGTRVEFIGNDIIFIHKA